ncbi:GH1 family beta-glucosidase [Microbacterium pumilum]|uniref:Beta-glucosidase n=1 Tax=Microbacterium pumilum TaxID=344165 RepID=A0ABN2RTB1_9MICO
MSEVRFPDDFVFGAATSAYQIEGAWNEAGKGRSIWDTFSQTPGNVWNDISGDVAVDHYHRWREDIALMKEIGLDSYRFSLSWSRLLPEGTGRVNEEGVAFYSRLIDGLLEAGISPNVTLYHWDLPQALQDRGGWANRDIVDWFAEYAALVFDRFGDRVARWVTINEPIALWVGYGLGIFAPGIADERVGKQAMHHAMLAHGRAVEAFRASSAIGEIGIVLDIWARHPATDSPADRDLAVRDEDDGFRFFLDELFTGRPSARIVERLTASGIMPAILPGDERVVTAPIDFLGLNVYSRVVVSAEDYNPRWWEAADSHPGGNYLTNGMEYYPTALTDAVTMVKDDYGVTLPLFITENGISLPADAVVDGAVHDPERIDYLAGFLAEAGRAVAAGADIRGFYVWSLLDNYEWSASLSERYGLIHVDHSTQARTMKDSARWYADVIRNGRVAER